MARKYRQVSFSTTLRNPNRIYGFLLAIKKYDGIILNNQSIENIMTKLISEGIYKPMKKSEVVKNKWNNGEILTIEETKKIMLDNPQTHKEAGFDEGWPSRWATQYSLLKEFGFIYYEINKKIIITDKGNAVLEHDIVLQEALRHTLLGHSSFAFRPGQLSKQNITLNIFEALKTKTMLSTEQIFALACMVDNSEANRNSLLDDPSQMNIEKLWGAKFPKNKYEKRSETVDDIIRKVMLTGLFKVEFVNNIFTFRIADEYINVSAKKAGIRDLTHLNDMEYHAKISEKPEEYIEVKTNDEKESFLEYWDSKLGIEDVRKLIRESANKKAKFHIKQLLYVPRYVVYELAIGLFLHKTNNGFETIMNLHFDSNFTPTAPASGGYSDIVLVSDTEKINVEVTLLLGVSQYGAEAQSTIRHLINAKADKLLFIAPKLSRDMVSSYQFEASRKQNKDITLVNSTLLIDDTKNSSVEKLIEYNLDFIRNPNNQSQLFFDFLNESEIGRTKYKITDFISKQ